MTGRNERQINGRNERQINGRDVASPSLLRALRLTWSAAWQEAWANQRGFWTQVALMCVNNMVFVFFWLVFFNRVRSLQGWDADRVLLLLSILATVAGVVLGLLHNVRRLGRLAMDGGLDGALSLPVPTLAYLVVRRVEPVNVGDLLFGLVLFIGFGSPTPTRVLIFGFGVICGATVLLGFFTLVGSMGFFGGPGDLGDLGLQSVLLFANYPIDVFPGLLRLLLYVVIPAGFVTGVPVRLVTEFSLGWALLAAATSLLFLAIGYLAFRLGLRRYTSGSVWTSA